MINLVKSELCKQLPLELVEALLSEYKKLKENYLLSKHEPSELNAGKFCEVGFRVIQFLTDPKQNYTPLKKEIHNFTDECRKFESSLSSSINDTLKLHVPRVLIALYNIRNHRGVGHIGGDINPNSSDANLLVTGCDWILAEFIRLVYSCDITTASNLVKNIIKRPTFFVYAFGDRKRVLKIKGYENKVLLLLLEEYPNSVSDETLYEWTEHSHSTVFKAMLKRMHKDDMIDYHNQQCVITTIGITEAENIIQKNT